MPQKTIGRPLANQGSLVPLRGSRGSLVDTLDVWCGAKLQSVSCTVLYVGIVYIETQDELYGL